jgi:hypothetical protein
MRPTRDPNKQELDDQIAQQVAEFEARKQIKKVPPGHRVIVETGESCNWRVQQQKNLERLKA